MNPAGLFAGDGFAPDINITPARAVYPTARGATTAQAAAAMSPASTTVANTPTGPQGTVTAAPSIVPQSGRTVWWWLGLLGFLAAMVFIARKAGGEEDFRNIRPTVYNFLTITLTAMVGFVGLKILAARFRIPGASDVILAA